MRKSGRDQMMHLCLLHVHRRWSIRSAKSIHADSGPIEPVRLYACTHLNGGHGLSLLAGEMLGQVGLFRVNNIRFTNGSWRMSAGPLAMERSGDFWLKTQGAHPDRRERRGLIIEQNGLVPSLQSRKSEPVQQTAHEAEPT